MPEFNWLWYTIGLVIGNITGFVIGVIICRQAIDKMIKNA